MSIGGLNIGDIGIGNAALGLPGLPVTAPAVHKFPANGRTPSPWMVDFYPLDGSAGVSVTLGDGPATLSGGDGGWTEEARQGEAPVTWWQSPSAYRQSIPVLLDSGVSQEQIINALQALARTPGSRQPPPAVMIAGQAIHRADLVWVVEGIDWGTNVIRRASDGNRVRQDATVRLLQYSEVEVIVERSPSKRAAGKGKSRTHAGRGRTSYRVQRGDTLPRIAARPDIYNDAGQWKRIANANHIRDPRSLTVGRTLKIPR